MLVPNAHQRVKIVSLEESHLSDLSKFANNPAIADNLMDRFPSPFLLKDAYEFWELIKKEEPQYTFAIKYRQDFCGVISITPQEDIYRLNAELGYWVAEPFWGKGIASSAIKKICDYGFGQLGMQRIFARVFEHNQGSMKSLEKNNFKKEALLEKAAIKNEQLFDIHMYGKTAL